MSTPDLRSPVPVRPDEPLQRVPMSYDDFLELPEEPRAEWVDGVAIIMNAPVLPPHGSSVIRLVILLAPLFPEHEVLTEVGLALDPRHLRGPDLMLCVDPPTDDWVRTPPLLCVEVLSTSTRTQDLVDKAAEYAGGGVGQYWLVDPRRHTLEARRLVDGRWQVLARLDDDHPTADIELAGVTVPLDLRQIVRR